jgi:hypothetical protein
MDPEHTIEDNDTKPKDSKEAEKKLGKLLRKTLIELVDDFHNLGGEDKFCESLREAIRIKGPLEILKHLRSSEFSKNHFLLGKLPLSFLIECDKGEDYIKILNLANTDDPTLEKWFYSLRPYVSTKPSGPVENTGIESMLNMIDPSLNLGENSPLIALTKDLTKEFLNEMPGSGPNMNLNQMMKKIQTKLESKLSSGQLDVNELQSQAEQVMSKLNQNHELSGLLSNPELLASMAGLGGGLSKKR